MAFVRTVQDGNLHADLFQESGNEVAVHLHVGYDEETDKNYSIVVGLSPQPPGDHELFFCMVEVDAENDSEREIWDGREVGRIIPKDDRQKILNVVLTAAKGLVDVYKPKCLIISTHGDYLPDKALEKFFMLLTLLKDSGYTITGADTYHGRHCWWAERDPQLPVVAADRPV